MSEKDLGKALLNLDAAALAAVPDSRQQTWTILARDKRRVRLLTWVTIFVCLLAAILVFGGLAGFAMIFPKQAELMRRLEEGQIILNIKTPPPSVEEGGHPDHHEEGRITPTQRDEIQRTLLMGFQKGTLMIAFSVAVMSLTLFSTILLILATRRATLRQVNASLVEISEQLKQLRGISK